MKLLELFTIDDYSEEAMGAEWYLEPSEDMMFAQTVAGWNVRRYMDDEIHGFAYIVEREGMAGPWDVAFKLTLYSDKTADMQFSNVYRGLSKKQILERFREWIWEKVHDHQKYLVNEDLFNQLQKARRKQRMRDAGVLLVRLNKDGKESKMPDASTPFDNEDDAISAHNHRVKANPGKKIEHNLHSRGHIDMVIKLSGEVDL